MKDLTTEEIIETQTECSISFEDFYVHVHFHSGLAVCVAVKNGNEFSIHYPEVLQMMDGRFLATTLKVIQKVLIPSRRNGLRDSSWYLERVAEGLRDPSKKLPDELLRRAFLESSGSLRLVVRTFS